MVACENRGLLDNAIAMPHNKFGVVGRELLMLLEARRLEVVVNRWLLGESA